jgi:hypothetical protein
MITSNIFIEFVSAKNTQVVTDGIISGIVTLKNLTTVPAPSIIAASIS